MVDNRSLMFGRKKAQALLAYLALAPRQVHPRDKLVALLWRDADADAGRHNLRQALLAIRRSIPADIPSPLVSDRDGISVREEALIVDVREFERLVARGTPDGLAGAADLYRGDLLAGIADQGPAFEEWLLAERARLHELAIEALARLLDHQKKRGPAEAALRTALQLLALDPLQEVVHRTIMRLYAAQGRRAAALRQYQSCVAVLRRELGVEPEIDTRHLYREILQSGGAEDAAVAPLGAAQLPARGEAGVHETPLIGRDASLDTLRSLLVEAWGGRPRTAIVVGEAGIGKTRLVEEFAAHAAAASDAARVLHGRCYETERVLPFGPWVSVFRGGQVLVDADVVARLPPPLRVALARVFPSLDERGDVAPDPDNRSRLFDAVRAAVDLVGARTPLLIVLDDLHWADEMSLTLLAYLGRRLTSAPVMIVGTVRDEELATAEGLRRTLDELRAEPGSTLLALAPLSRSQTEQLARSLARAGSDDATITRFTERVWAASEGNPFVALETIRAIQDGTLPPGDVALPERVRDVITRRLERLGAPSRHLLGVAAVIGSEVPFTLLERAGGLGELETADALEELVRRRLISVAGEGFSFTHDRVRHVAEETLHPARRRALHAAIGRALEALYAGRRDDVAEQLAYHWARTKDDAKAVEHLVRFADQASRVYAVAAAVAALEEALRRTEGLASAERDRQAVDIVLRLAHLTYFLGQADRALDALRSVADRVESLGDSATAGRYHVLLGRIHSLKGEHARAVAAVWGALAHATRAGDDATAGKAHCVLAQESYWSDSPRGCTEHAEQAISLFGRVSEPWWAGLSHWTAAVGYTVRGRLPAARIAASRVVEIGRTLHDRRLECYGTWSLGWIGAVWGDGTAPIPYCEHAIALAPDPVGEVNARAALGYVRLELGDAAGAIACLEEATARMRALELVRPFVVFLAMLGDAYRLAGRAADAERAATEAIGLARDTGYRYALGWAERALARVTAETSAEAGRALGQRAVATFAAIDARLECARTHLDLARMTVRAGQRATSATHLDEARAGFAALSLEPWLRRTADVGRDLGIDGLDGGDGPATGDGVR